jgi:4-oxalocrotonate tautomerase
MPYVNVRITDDNVTSAQKDEVIKGITDVLVQVLGKNPETTFVVIDEVPLENWGHRGTSIATARRQPSKP